MKIKFYNKRKFGGEHKDFYNLINWNNIPLKNKKIKFLDVGCANGYGIKIVSHNLSIGEKNLFGVDISKQKMVCKFNFRICDLNNQKLPFNKKTFNLVSSFEVIEHIYDTRNYIHEINRILKRNGYFIISTPNLAWWVNRILLFLGFQPANTEVDLYHSMYGKPKFMKESVSSGHIHVFTKKALDEFLTENYFKILKRIRFSSNYIGKLKIFSIFDKLLSRIPSFAKNYVYICKKINDVDY
jgi:SAM-dependent methyltransferase